MSLPYAATAGEMGRAQTLSHAVPHNAPYLSQDSLHSLAQPPSQASAVAWGAILAGAAAAAALSLILLVLGVGLGLSSVSPWAQTGASAIIILIALFT